MHRLALTVLLALPAAAQNYDLLLKGGHVIDPRNNIDGVRDIAISGGRSPRRGRRFRRRGRARWWTCAACM